MGKLATEELKKLLSCIKKDPRVLVPPQLGFDAGVHRIGDKYVAVATDPCMGVPEEWFGWLLVNYAASDLALFGAKTEFCTITLMGPRTTQPQIFQKIMKQTCSAVEELGMAIVRGHTGTYDGITELVGVCTAYGTVALERLITPGNAQPNDLIFVTKPIGLETAVNFALTHKVQAEKLFGKQAAETLASQIHMQSCVKEALQLAELSGVVHAMHDATEGGFVAALNEMAEASKLGFKVDYEKLPVTPEVLKLQEAFNLTYEQTLALSSTGTIIAAVKPEEKDSAAEALRKNGLEASFVGGFTKAKNRVLTKNGKENAFPKKAEDQYAKILRGKES
jgi:hydrogenase expression/formation protein HypE